MAVPPEQESPETGKLLPPAQPLFVEDVMWGRKKGAEWIIDRIHCTRVRAELGKP
ncbi:MAG: hypothetical protein ABI240_18790 [Sphingomonas sp.]